MNFFKKKTKKSSDTSAPEGFGALIDANSGPVLRIMLKDAHIATLFHNGNSYCLLYHNAFLNAGVAPFNPEQLKRNDTPEVDKCYYSEILWHSFASRIPSSDRPDFQMLLKNLGLTGNENSLVILSKVGSVSISKPWRLELVKSNKGA